MTTVIAIIMILEIGNLTLYMKQTLPIDCVLAITYHCNSRCTMCDIWKMTDFTELPASEFAKLPSSLRDINLSGGEPFLRTDLAEIVKVLVKACPNARIVISSNGFATDLILHRMKDVLKIKPDIGVAISIDGIGEMHNELRGIPGGFDRAIKTVKELQQMGMTNLRLAYTLMEKNVTHLSKVYDLSRELGVEFTHSFAQSSEFYFGGKDNVGNVPRKELMTKEYKNLIKNELRSWNIKRWLRAYFAFGMYQFVIKKKQLLDNAPGRDFFFMDPAGNIYRSVVHNVVLENINNVIPTEAECVIPAKAGFLSCIIDKDPSFRRDDSKKQDDSFEKFWQSDTTEKLREKADTMKIPVWMICTARTAIKNHPFRVGWWILKNKFFMSSP